MNVNKSFLAGRCTRDPQLKYLSNQTAVCELGIAHNEKYKDKEHANFFDLVAFGKQAEFIAAHFHKGKEIFVECRARYESWDDKNGGGKRSKVSFVVENVQFVGAKGDNAGASQEEVPDF